jgi:transposase InsO family protein
MSKRRSVILSVVVEGLSQAETARLYDVSEATVSRWVARWRVVGDAAFEPASRRPKTSPTATSSETVALIVELRGELTDDGLDAGAETIRWHLRQRHRIVVSVSTIRRHLVAAGLITPEPKKRPKSSYIRFEAALPNETWQTDMTHWALANSVGVEVLSWLDDHSRMALGVTAHQRVNSAAVVDTFHETAGQHGYPASVLSDNGMYFTARFARGGASGPNRFETVLAEYGIVQKNSRPNHPTTCGKVERFQQTLKKWLRKQPSAATIADLQAQLDTFVDIYNHHRPHRSLGRATPHVAYTRLPKTGPTATTGTRYRIRRDRVDNQGKVTLRYNGRLHHIGIGRTHTGTAIIMLINNRDIRIIATDTAELLRTLTLDPDRDYQPQNPKSKKPEP